MRVDVVKDFEIINDPTYDNGDRLMRMRKALTGLDKPHYILIFPYMSQIIYNNNRWLWGIRSFELEGNHSTFRSSYDGQEDEALSRSFFIGELFQNNVLEYHGTKVYNITEKFKSASAGSNFIELERKIYDHKPGDMIVLYANNYDDLGYPPPSRAEWRKIKSISGNFIFLDYPIENNYLTNVWDNPIISGGGSGFPRILNLNRSENPYCEFAKFTNVVIGKSVNDRESNFTFPAKRVEMVGCKMQNGYIWPSETEHFHCDSGELDKIELDKIINTIEFKNVKFNKSANGGGSANKIIITDSYGAESFRFNSRYVDLKRNHIRNNNDPDQWISTLADYPARNPIRRYTIDELTFSSGPDSRSDAHIGIAPLDDHSMIVIDDTLNNSIVTTNFNIVKQLEEGTTSMFNEDGSDGGLITSMTYNGSSHIISGNWNHIPTGIWRWCHVKEVIDMGGHRVLDGRQLWHGNSIRWKGNTTSGIHTMHLDQNDFTGNRLIDIYGYLINIECLGFGDIQIQNADPFENIRLNFSGFKWVKKLYLIGSGGRFNITIKWKQF